MKARQRSEGKGGEERGHAAQGGRGVMSQLRGPTSQLLAVELIHDVKTTVMTENSLAGLNWVPRFARVQGELDSHWLKGISLPAHFLPPERTPQDPDRTKIQENNLNERNGTHWNSLQSPRVAVVDPRRVWWHPVERIFVLGPRPREARKAHSKSLETGSCLMSLRVLFRVSAPLRSLSVQGTAVSGSERGRLPVTQG